MRHVKGGPRGARVTRAGAAVAVAAAALIAGCGGGGGGPSGGPAGPDTTVEPTAKIDLSAKPSGKITFAVPADAPGDIKKRTAQAKAFMADNPGTDIQIVTIPSTGYDQKVMTRIAAGNPPDLFGSGDVQIPTLVNRNYALDLKPYMEADGFDTAAFYPEVIDSLTYDGKIVGLTDLWDTQALYYNKKLFAAAGVEEPTADWTWDDYRNAAKQLTSGEGRDKTYGSLWQKWFVPVADAVGAAGGAVYDDAGTKCTINTPESVQALTFLDDLRKDGSDPGATEDRVLGRTGDEVFMAGKAAMLVGTGRWGVGMFGEVDGLEWGVAPLPKGPSGDRSNFFHLPMFGIASNSKNPNLAWKFLRYVTSKEALADEVADAEGVPAIKALAESPAVAEAPQVVEHNALAPFVDSLPTARRAPALTNFSRYQDKVDDQLLPLWKGQKSPQEAADAACKAVDAEFEKTNS
jgi:multiple sugar transport system substrate-binding protein